MATRRGKWHQLPPSQTPRILNLPRRSRSSRTSSATRTKPDRHPVSLFELEKRVRAESAPVSPPRRSHCDEDSGEEKWRFQAEMLRAECNFLRMEREVAVRKLDRQRGQMESALKSAMETLVSGRKKIDGGNLDEEIRDLEEMLDELQMEKEGGRQSFRQLQRCRGRNFDRQASTLRRRLEKMPVSEEVSVKEIREITLPVVHRREKSMVPDDDETDHQIAAHDQIDDQDENAQMPDVEVLKRKMEGLSKGMVERMVEYGFMPHWKQEQGKAEEIGKKGAEISGGCECREIVGKIMEQVKVESEQWTEMQAMLEQVRQEMVELQSSRDLWQRRAIASDVNIRPLHAQVLEWKHRARVSENNVEELEKRVSELQNRLHSMKIEHLAHKTSQENIEACKSNMKLNSQWQMTLSDLKRENEKQMTLVDHRRENEKQMTLADHRRESEKQMSLVDHRRENEKQMASTDQRRESEKQMLLADHRGENEKQMTLADHWRENEKQMMLADHRRDNEKHNLVRRLKKLPSHKTRRAPFTEVSNFLKQ